MCTGAELIPLIVSAVGTGASVVDNQATLKRQDREAARGIMRQAEMTRQASGRVNQEIQKTAASTPEADRQIAQQDFMAALQKADLNKGGAGLTSTGAVSDRFAEDVGAARTAAGAENAATAGTLARIDAPRFQRLREGQSSAAAVSDLGMLGKNSSMEDFLTRLRVSSQTSNPWVQGASQGLTAFGGALAQRTPRDPLQPFDLSTLPQRRPQAIDMASLPQRRPL